jgi:hypothetical protein
MILYRILRVIVNLFCAFVFMSTIVLVLFALSSPGALLQFFLMASVVLYGWFANRFYAFVIVGKQKMSKKQKDWLQVNSIVAAVFAIMGIANSIYVFNNPHLFDEMIKQMPIDASATPKLLMTVAIILLVLSAILFIHIIWTYVLIRKNRESFISE